MQCGINSKAMSVLAMIVVLPVLFSLVLLFRPFKRRKTTRRITAAGSLLALGGIGYVLRGDVDTWQLLFPPQAPALLHRISHFLVFGTEGASGLMLLLFAVMMCFLAFNALLQKGNSPGENRFFAWYWFSAGLGFAIFTAAHFYLLVFLWGISVIPLYMLASGFSDERAELGKKTLVIHGGAHVLMVTGAVIAVSLSLSADIAIMQTATTTTAGTVGFLLLLAGGLAAMGIFPLHSWVTPFATYASGRSFALMPLVFQRLAGTYLLIRLCHDVFILSGTLQIILIALGLLSVILALAMAVGRPDAGSKLANLHIAIGGMALAGIATDTQAGILAALILVTFGGAVMMPVFLRNLQTSSSAVVVKWIPRTDKRLFKALKRLEDKTYTDIYKIGAKAVFAMHRPLSRLHDGVLQTYLVWVVVAMIVLFLLK